MSPDRVLLIGVGLIFAAISIAAFTIISGTFGRRGVARALASIDRDYAPGSAGSAEDGLRQRMSPAVQQVTTLGKSLTPKGATAWLARWLDYAGNPPAWPPARVMEMQGQGLLIFAILGGVVGLFLGLSAATILLFLVAGAVFGFWLPFLVVYEVAARRQEQVRRQLPDVLDLLTLSVEAGLGFDAATAQVVATMPGALSREFARLLHEMQMGKQRGDALRALAARTNVLELRAVASSLVQAGELGVPTAQVLREQARQMRVKRRQRAEEEARKLPVKVIFPLILCLFPVLFILIIGPGAINIMDALTR
jgi:tight adherence protein C